jgi:small basic protein
MAILVTILIALVVIGFGVYVFGNVDSIRRRHSGQQSLESWYSRFSDKHRR